MSWQAMRKLADSAQANLNSKIPAVKEVCQSNTVNGGSFNYNRTCVHQMLQVFSACTASWRSELGHTK